MATSNLGINTSPIGIARGLCTFFGVLSSSVGLYGILQPVAYSETFGFPKSSHTVTTSSQNPFIVVASGRLLSGGLANLACVALGLDRAAGVLMCSGFVTGLFDGLAVLWYSKETTAETKKAVAGHWGIPATVAAMGVWMVANAER